MATGAIVGVTVQGADQGDTTTIGETDLVIPWLGGKRLRLVFG